MAGLRNSLCLERGLVLVAGSRNGLCLDRGVEDKVKKWLERQGPEIRYIHAQCEGQDWLLSGGQG